jgi:hypothetical protein
MSDNTTTVHGKPSEDMCCLVTMEDITIEDGNYGACLLHFRHFVGFKRPTLTLSLALMFSLVLFYDVRS